MSPWSLVLALPLAAGAQDEPLVLEAGPLTIEVHLSPTAQLFHVVDQLSAWSPFCHGQYARGMAPLDDADRDALELHRGVRADHGWGGGLEQTFYTPLDLDAALAAGVRDGRLTQAEADLEGEVLARFAPRVEALFEEERERLLAFREGIQRDLPALADFSAQLARLFRTPALDVPVYLIADPSDQEFGGGYNGGRLTMEIPRVADARGIFLHEVFHAFLEARKAEIEHAIAGVDERLDYQTIDEGLAHAISPGIHHAGPPGDDPLVRRVEEVRRRGQGLDDYHGRVYRYALALRPLVREALQDEEIGLERLLPRAVDAWRVMVELELPRNGDGVQAGGER